MLPEILFVWQASKEKRGDITAHCDILDVTVSVVINCTMLGNLIATYSSLDTDFQCLSFAVYSYVQKFRVYYLFIYVLLLKLWQPLKQTAKFH
jgi:ethanolamine transporter EutH